MRSPTRSSGSSRGRSRSRRISSRAVPGFAIVGLADRACQEAKHRVRSGVVSASLEWPLNRRITVNLAPAALRKEGSGFDLPISLAVLGATRQLPPERLAEHAAVGELALDGRIRPVSGTLAVAEGARRGRADARRLRRGVGTRGCARGHRAGAGAAPRRGRLVLPRRDRRAGVRAAAGSRRRRTGATGSRGRARSGARAPRARDRGRRVAQPAAHGPARHRKDDARASAAGNPAGSHARARRSR